MTTAAKTAPAATTAKTATATTPVAATEKPAKTAPVFVGVGFKMAAPPKKSTAGTRSIYPFDQLEKGSAFGVKGKTARDLGTVITNNNKRNKTETVGAPGQAPTVTVDKHFYAVDVTPDIAETIKGTPLEGSDVLVYREI